MTLISPSYSLCNFTQLQNSRRSCRLKKQQEDAKKQEEVEALKNGQEAEDIQIQAVNRKSPPEDIIGAQGAEAANKSPAKKSSPAKKGVASPEKKAAKKISAAKEAGKKRRTGGKASSAVAKKVKKGLTLLDKEDFTCEVLTNFRATLVNGEPECMHMLFALC